MTDDTSVPGPRRDLAMHNDWWNAGWEHVLPRQGFPLTMLLATASHSGFTGSLDDLLRDLFGGHWRLMGGGLDSPLTFSWPEEEWDHEDAPEGREAHEARRWERFGAMLTAAGHPVPRTVRDLSELYLTWGLAHREETPDGTRWSMPAVLPLPGDLLPLDADLTEREDLLAVLLVGGVGVPEPLHGLAGQPGTVGEPAVGSGVEAGIGDGVEQHLLAQCGSAALLGHEGDGGGHIAADAVTGHGHA
jgi:hypothetical protein